MYKIEGFIYLRSVRSDIRLNTSFVGVITLYSEIIECLSKMDGVVKALQ